MIRIPLLSLHRGGIGLSLACLLGITGGCGPRVQSPTTGNTATDKAKSLNRVREVEAVPNFKYPAGTVLAAHAAKGQFSLVKVLRVERLKTDDSHNGKIIIHFRTYDDLFPSLATATKAASSKTLKVRVADGTAGEDFLQQGVQRVAAVPVTEDELGGYRKWRLKYEAGEADAFPV